MGSAFKEYVSMVSEIQECDKEGTSLVFWLHGKLCIVSWSKHTAPLGLSVMSAPAEKITVKMLLFRSLQSARFY